MKTKLAEAGGYVRDPITKQASQGAQRDQHTLSLAPVQSDLPMWPPRRKQLLWESL